MQYSQEHLKTMVYAKFGGQTECIMGNWKIENFSHGRRWNWLMHYFWIFLIRSKCSCLYYISVSYISKWKVVFIGYCQSVKRIGRAVEFSRIHSLCAERNYFLVGRDILSTAYTSQHSNKVQLQDSNIYLRWVPSTHRLILWPCFVKWRMNCQKNSSKEI